MYLQQPARSVPSHPWGEGEGSRLSSHSKPEYASVFQVDVSSTTSSVSPLSPMGRGGRAQAFKPFKIRVRLGFSGRCIFNNQLGQSPLTHGARGKGAGLQAIQNQSTPRFFRSMYLQQPARSVPSHPWGEGEGSRLSSHSKSEYASVFQVDVSSTTSSVSPLSPMGRGGREQAFKPFKTRVRLGFSGRCIFNNQLGQSPLTHGARGKGAGFQAIQNQSTPRFFRSMYLQQPTRSVPSHPWGEGEGSRLSSHSKPEYASVFQVDVSSTTSSVSPLSPMGRGGREQAFKPFKIRVRLGFSGRCIFNNQLGQSPLTHGARGKGAGFQAIQNQSTPRFFRSMYLQQPARSVPSHPWGEGEGSRLSSHSKPEYASVFQVDVSSTANSVSPLYLWERARVRAGPEPGIHNHGKTQSKKKRPEGRQKIHLLPKEQGASKGEFASTAQSKNRQRILDNHPHFIQIRLERRGAGCGLAQAQ